MAEGSDDENKDLSAAAVDSVKGAIERARERKAKFLDRRGIANTSSKGEINVGPRANIPVPYGNAPLLPYLQRRQTGLLTGPDDSDVDDSNDEWEEHVDVDEEAAQASVNAAKAAVEAAAAARRAKVSEVEKSEGNSSSKTGSAKAPLTEEQRREAEKNRKRVQAARQRSRVIRQYESHVVMLVSLLARMDAAANDEELQAFAMSMVPEDVLIRGQGGTIECLGRFALWFRMEYRFLSMFRPSRPKRPCSIVERVRKSMMTRCGHVLDLAVLATAMLRAEGERCRIVVPLQPVLEQVPKHVKTGKGIVQKTGGKSTEFCDPGFYSWLEVWSEAEDKWVPLDFCVGLVDANSTKDVLANVQGHVRDLYSQSSAYARDQAILDKSKSARMRREQQEQSIKRIDESCLSHVVAAEREILTDVTRRYAENWKVVEKQRGKGRVLERVLNELSRHLEDEDPIAKKEDEFFDALAAKDEMPTSIAACHKHPRYILERHLKKYEILYPRNPIVGYIKKEPIFLRSRVKLLHSKDRWVRKMREVKPNAKPLKHVKSAMARDPEDKTPLFGEWQTVPLVVEECKNGKVPRNERGQIDLWTEEHLPKGAVHVNLHFAAAAARSLGFDFAPAMTGFDLRGRRSVPRYEGIVIAKENASVVIDAAREKEAVAVERAEAIAREEACKRWKSLLKTMVAREKVRKKYGGMADYDGTFEEVEKRKGLKRARDEKMQERANQRQTKRSSPDRNVNISPEGAPSRVSPREGDEIS